MMHHSMPGLPSLSFFFSVLFFLNIISGCALPWQLAADGNSAGLTECHFCYCRWKRVHYQCCGMAGAATSGTRGCLGQWSWLYAALAHPVGARVNRAGQTTQIYTQKRVKIRQNGRAYFKGIKLCHLIAKMVYVHDLALPRFA